MSQHRVTQLTPHSNSDFERFIFQICQNSVSYLIPKKIKAVGANWKRADTHSLHVENGRLHKATAKVVNNEGGDAEVDAVLTQRAHYQHPLEIVTAVIPIT